MSRNNYKIAFTKHGKKKRVEGLTKNDELTDKFLECIATLLNDPKDISLKTEKKFVRISKEKKYCSNINGDWRIIWEYSDDEQSILILDIGTHNGSNCVYQKSSF